MLSVSAQSRRITADGRSPRAGHGKHACSSRRQANSALWPRTRAQLARALACQHLAGKASAQTARGATFEQGQAAPSAIERLKLLPIKIALKHTHGGRHVLVGHELLHRKLAKN